MSSTGGMGSGGADCSGLSVGSVCQVRLRHGPLLGGMVWLASYITLPIAGVYKPIWSYDLKTLWDDLSAHLVYGVGVVLALLASRRGECR